ncbi:GNAT family N-acetyltransferase [Demequina mangrovi]|uniref:Ribosomal protein S18 acetylase RimI n=1 Tax=Demequina mangrovi TaxID=1043493 RepID=A0A1H6YWV4_9MICO|nr:GNAT family N-acetyltransferase [Demequina mangrovi]SEJ45688.1 Ribosomal protein S18 acetylase RimI [Demequina mangrovi]
MSTATIHRASPADAARVARLLHEFNVAYDTPSPGPRVLEERLLELLAGAGTDAFLAGSPAIGVALVTYRTNVWWDGPVALLDELYVRAGSRGRGIGAALVGAVVARAREREVELLEVNVDEGDVDALRFYEREGFAVLQPDTDERALYLSRELPASPPESE